MIQSEIFKIIDANDPFSQFEKIADHIMNKMALKVRDQKYRIYEIEFYYRSANHYDSYTHGKEEQKQNARWYIHKRGNSIIKSKRQGLDIAIGDNISAYGGILIRAIHKFGSERQAVCGPSNVVEEIKEHLGDQFYVFQEAPILNSNSDLCLFPEDTLPYVTPQNAPRYGLKETEKDDRAEFHSRPYRFFLPVINDVSMPLRGKEVGIMSYWLKSGIPEEDIKKKLKVKTIPNYLKKSI